MGFSALQAAVGFGPPPCSGDDVVLFPSKCGGSPTGPPIGKANGSYCAKQCSAQSPCAAVSGLIQACTMNQGDGRQFCEYQCKSDSDCPNKGSCQKNIVASICTYPNASPTPSPPAPTPKPHTPSPPTP